MVGPRGDAGYACLSAYLVGGLEGHYYPNLYSPAGVDIDATVTGPMPTRTSCAASKAVRWQLARWGIKVLEMSAEIGRRTELPLYVHFGTLWGLPESGANGEDADTILERVIPDVPARRYFFGPSVHAPSGGFVNRQGEVHSVKFAPPSTPALGHGSHFSYRIARHALAAGIVPHTLGADMHGYNTEVHQPPGTPAQHDDGRDHPFRGQAKFSLTQAMSSMLALALEQTWCRW